MIIIKNIDVYSPDYIGKKDIFISGGKINLIRDNIARFNRKIILPQRPDSQHNEKLTVSLRTGLLSWIMQRSELCNSVSQF